MFFKKLSILDCIGLPIKESVIETLHVFLVIRNVSLQCIDNLGVSSIFVG